MYERKAIADIQNFARLLPAGVSKNRWPPRIVWIGDSNLDMGSDALYSSDSIALRSTAENMTAGEGAVNIYRNPVSMSWRAPQDGLFGNRVSVVEGFNRLEARQSGKWFTVLYRTAFLDDFTGDSTRLTVNVTETGYSGRSDMSAYTWFNILSGNKYVTSLNMGITGDTTSNVKDRILSALVSDEYGNPLDAYPDIVFVLAGINNSIDDPEGQEADYLYLANLLESLNIHCVFITQVAESWDSEALLERQSVNNYLRNLANDMRMVHCVDAYLLGMNPVSGQQRADLIDGVHYTNNMGYLVGSACVDLVNAIYGDSSIGQSRYLFPVDPDNAFSNPPLAGTGGTFSGSVTGDIPDDVDVAAVGTVAAVVSIEARPGRLPYLVLTCNGAADGDTVTVSLPSVAISGLLNADCYFSVTGSDDIKNIDLILETTGGEQSATIHSCRKSTFNNQFQTESIEGLMSLISEPSYAWADTAIPTLKITFSGAGAVVVKLTDIGYSCD